MERYLEIAAIVLAAVIFALLIVAVVKSGMPRSVQVFRFRRSLKRLDDVAARWDMELPQRPSPPVDRRAIEPRHQRRLGRES